MRLFRYDFPNRMRGLPSAERELARLERSMDVAYHRRDTKALAYLERRHRRAERAYRLIQQQEGTTP